MKYSSYSFLTPTLYGVNGQRHAPAALYHRERTSGTHWTGHWAGFRAGLDTEAGDRTPVVQSEVRHYTDCTNLNYDDVVLGFDTVSTRRLIPAFRRNILSPSSGLNSVTPTRCCVSRSLRGDKPRITSSWDLRVWSKHVSLTDLTTRDIGLVYMPAH
jgi:hypothetical protein